FAEHMTRLAAGHAGGPEARHFDGGTRAADLYLAVACAARVPGAVDAFEHTHVRRVGTYLARKRPSAAFVDEVQQVVREKLFVGKDGAPPKIAEYSGQGGLAGWVRVIALRVAIDLSTRDAPVEESGQTADQPATGDPEVDYVKQRYRQAFNE